MSSSTDAGPAAVVRGEAAVDAATGLGDLRTGVWTRLGGSRVLGDAATEESLTGLAERTREAARAQGYAVGWAQGRREAAERARTEEAERAGAAERAEAARDREHRAAVAALERAAASLHQALAGAASRVEDAAVGLALELVTELVGREVALGADPVARALALLPTDGIARVRLHPAAVDATAIERLAARAVTVEADPDLGPGDALVEIDDRVLDLRIATALDRLQEALG